MLARTEGRAVFLTRLSWLAAQLKRMDAFYFRDHLTVGWIPGRRRRRTISLLIGGLAGLVTATASAVILVPRHQTAGICVAVGLLALSIAARVPDWAETRAEPVRTARLRGSWSVRDFRRGFAQPIGWVTIGSLVFDLHQLSRHVPDWGSYDEAQCRRVLVFALVAVLAVTGLGLIQGWRLEAVDSLNWAVAPALRPFGPFLLRSARWAGYAAVGTGLMIAPALATVRLILQLGGDRSPLDALRPAVADGLSAAAVVFVAVLVGLLGLRLEVTVVEASLRDDGLIPADLPAFLEEATRLALLQRTGGNEFMFSHQILRDHFAAAGLSPDRPRKPRPSGPAQ